MLVEILQYPLICLNKFDTKTKVEFNSAAKRANRKVLLFCKNSDIWFGLNLSTSPNLLSNFFDQIRKKRYWLDRSGPLVSKIGICFANLLISGLGLNVSESPNLRTNISI